MHLIKNAQHLLVVDDDTRIRGLLQKYLTEHGYFVSTVKNTKEAEQLLKEIQTDLMILDLMMPDENGVEFTKRLRIQEQNIPIIMLTAMGECDHRISGLEVGADDYIVKPFEPKELLLRIANILKRKQNNIDKIHHFGDFSYNAKTQALLQQNQPIFLTNSEHSLLGTLIKNTNQIVTREELAIELSINERSVDVQIVRLRNKIETDSSRPKLLQTVRGQGYILRI